MKSLVYGLILLFLFSCTKPESPAPVTPNPPPSITEEKILLTTNLDTGKVLLDDIVPLIITVSSKVPASGIQYSVTHTWNDSSKQIFKLDTTVFTNSFTVFLTGQRRTGNYTLQIVATSKSSTTNTLTKTISGVYIPIVPAVKTELDSKLNWNDHAQGKCEPYDFNKDGVPDIVTWSGRSFDPKAPPILYVKDYTGKTIFSFNIKDKKPTIRDSLNNLYIDFRDINTDGYPDFALSYVGEWDPNPAAGIFTSKFNGLNTFLLLSKGGLNFDVVDVLDIPKFSQFNINLFDWDFDGKPDLLASIMNNGVYFKNVGNNTFEQRTLTPLFMQSICSKYDYDKDGSLDFINLYVNQLDEQGKYSWANMNQTLTIVTSKTTIHLPVTGKKIDKYIMPTNNVLSAERITLLDGDKDGDMDLIIGNMNIENNVWNYIQEYYENTGNQLVYKPNFIELDKSLIGDLQVWSGDIDNDGDIDLYYPTYSHQQLSMPKWQYFWWENTGKGFKINKSFRLKY